MTLVRRVRQPVRLFLPTVLILLAGFAAPAAGPAAFSISSWTIEDGLPGNAVVALAKGGDGDLWLATINGLARLEGETWRFFGSESGLPDTYISCALERTARHGRLDRLVGKPGFVPGPSPSRAKCCGYTNKLYWN